MKNKISEFNNLYKPALERAEEIRRNLGRHCVDHVLVFFNNHHTRIDGKPELMYYPIPTIICKLSGIQTKIGFDIVTDDDYIGFVKFTFNKDEFSTFNFEAINIFKFEVYNSWFCEEVASQDVLEQVKNYVTKSNDRVFYIKIKISNIDEINTVINNMCIKPQKCFAMYSCVCNCGNQITIEAYDGQCPICGEDSPKKRKYETNCPVCNHITLVDKYGDGECKNCGWLIDKMSTKYRSRVIYPNLISLNKARTLYKEGKPFIPDFDDFIDGYNFYGEMEFTYNGITYGLMGVENAGVEFWGINTDKYETFKDIEEFKQKAQIDGKLLKDIWHEVENANWLQ